MYLIFPLCRKDVTNFARSHKKFVNSMRISKHIISFDGDYFGFLQDELKSLSKNIRKNFKEKIVKNYCV